MLGVILDTLQKFEILAVAKSIQMKTLCCNCTFQYVPKMYEYMDFFLFISDMERALEYFQKDHFFTSQTAYTESGFT